MAKKKQQQNPVSQEASLQAQHTFERYQEIASDLHASKDQEQVEEALTEINALPEDAQMALLKELSKEKQSDAADVLVAINELSSLKEVRKEARRSLIRLEGARIYPRWKPPIERAPALSSFQLLANQPRFWKGIVTDSLASGEVNLLLCWEQGEDYREVRVLGFLLEFWHDGVKDFFTMVESKRGFERFMDEMKRGRDIPTKDCSLAEGGRLLRKALATNTRAGTRPYRDYQMHLSLINQLMPATDDIDEDEDFDEDEEIDLSGLEPISVVASFVENWVEGEYGIAYTLLAQESPLREGLSKAEWIERREKWDRIFFPAELEPGLLYEREAPKSKLWLPNPFSKSTTPTQKVVEAGWSIELESTPLDDKLPELPEPTATYAESGRRWFWASYTLVQENGEWRIQDMTDEGTKARDLPIEELQKRMQELDEEMEKRVNKFQKKEIQQLSEDEMVKYVAEVLRPVLQSAYYTDALLTKLPLDRSLYEDAAGLMMFLSQYERCLVYLTPLVERFPEQHDVLYRRIASTLRLLGQRTFEEGDDDRAERFQELEEEALRKSLAVNDNWEAHISLAELLIEAGEEEQLDEAEMHLLRAKEQVTDPGDEAHVELHLGEIATEREQFKQALSHYQRMAELQPDSADAWYEVAEAHRVLENVEEAETAYKRTIELEPTNENYFGTLGLFYKEQGQFAKAVEVLENGLDANPDSVVLHFYIVQLYIENGDYQQAEIFLDKAERLDPTSALIPQYRQMLNLRKLEQSSTAPKAQKLLGQKKKGTHRHS